MLATKPLGGGRDCRNAVGRRVEEPWPDLRMRRDRLLQNEGEHGSGLSTGSGTARQESEDRSFGARGRVGELCHEFQRRQVAAADQGSG